MVEGTRNIMTPIELHMLRTLLDGMNVPETRRDINKAANVRWLLRNVAINNTSGQALTETIGMLLQLQREQRKS
jgi:hypothetical protein